MYRKPKQDLSTEFNEQEPLSLVHRFFQIIIFSIDKNPAQHFAAVYKYSISVIW